MFSGFLRIYYYRQNNYVNDEPNPTEARNYTMSYPSECVWSHDVFTNVSLDLIKERAQSPDQPFFLFVSYTVPHAGE